MLLPENVAPTAAPLPGGTAGMLEQPSASPGQKSQAAVSPLAAHQWRC